MSSTAVIFVLIGATGDLAVRKLLPAFEALAKRGELPSQLHLICVTRQSGISAPAFLDSQDCSVLQMDSSDPSQYTKLNQRIADLEGQWGVSAERIIYLSVPPTASKVILEHLALIDLARTKVVIEKPFGTDLVSAQSLLEKIGEHITPEQTYLMDHYVAKEFAEDISQFSTVHHGLLQAHQIERVEIIASESIGVEGRVNFYEQTGALRDVVQNHLLALTALLIAGNDPSARAQALGNIEVVNAQRGQYEAYKRGNPTSTTETFAVLELISRDSLWADVPFVLATGKALAVKETVVRVITHTGEEIVFRDTNSHTTYERVLMGVFQSNHGRFVSPQEVLSAWQVIAPVQQTWQKDAYDLELYAEGTDISELIHRE